MTAMDIQLNQVIQIPNRYGEITQLIPLNEHIYKVDFSLNPYPYRLIFDDNKEIIGIDPQGGPMINVGNVINNILKVTSIYKEGKDLLVTLDYVKEHTPTL